MTASGPCSAGLPSLGIDQVVQLPAQAETTTITSRRRHGAVEEGDRPEGRVARPWVGDRDLPRSVLGWVAANDDVAAEVDERTWKPAPDFVHHVQRACRSEALADPAEVDGSAGLEACATYDWVELDWSAGTPGVERPG